MPISYLQETDPIKALQFKTTPPSRLESDGILEARLELHASVRIPRGRWNPHTIELEQQRLREDAASRLYATVRPDLYALRDELIRLRREVNAVSVDTDRKCVAAIEHVDRIIAKIVNP